MDNKTFEEIVVLWQADKKQYVKRSTYSAYLLLIANHLLPAFAGDHILLGKWVWHRTFLYEWIEARST